MQMTLDFQVHKLFEKTTRLSRHVRTDCGSNSQDLPIKSTAKHVSYERGAGVVSSLNRDDAAISYLTPRLFPSITSCATTCY